jgi:hypothetical protein
VPSVVRARVVEEVRLRKGTPAAKYLKLVLNVIDGLRFAESTINVRCDGGVFGNRGHHRSAQANESFPGPIEGYDVQASSKGRSTAETKT